MQLLQKFTRIILLISLSVWLTACGGGGGGVRVDSIDLDQPSSPTYAPSIVVAGNLVMIKPPLNDPGDKYSDSVKVKWRNHLTGESGSANHKFSGSCVFLLITVSCASHNESSLSISIALAVGNNIIIVEAEGKEALVEVVRQVSAPYVDTHSVNDIGLFEATLYGTVNPRGSNTDAWFEYSTDSGLSSSNSTPIRTMGSVGADLALSEMVSNLSENITYYYRVVASNTYGTIAGEIKSFTTLIDTSAPTLPTGLTAVSVSTQNPEINLAWEESVDDFMVAGYKIYRNGVLIDDVSDLYFNDTALDATTRYCYSISAYDTSINESALSPQACATTSWINTKLASGLERPKLSLALDPLDKVHIAYTTMTFINNGQDRIDELSYITNASGSWIIESIDDVASKPNLAINLSGAAHIGHHYKYTTNQSGSWVSENIISPSQNIYSLALDSAGNVYLLTGQFGVAVVIRNNSTGVWVVEPITAGYYSAMTIDALDAIHIVAYDRPSKELRYTTNTTGSWTTEVVVANIEINWDMGIAVDSNRKVHISYYEIINRDLQYATNATGAWVVETADSQDDVGSGSAIAVDDAGKVHISYTDQTAKDLKYVSNALGSWEPSVIDSATIVTGAGWSDTHTVCTGIAVDSMGKVHISYHGGQTTTTVGNQEIWYATNQ